MSSTASRWFPGLAYRLFVLRQRQTDDVNDSSVEVSPADEVSAGTKDEELMARLQNDDLTALGTLYRRYARLVYSIAVRILRDSTEAEDLVHDVFLLFHRKCRLFDPSKGNARSWLVKVVYRESFNRRVYLKRRNYYGDGEPPTAGSHLAAAALGMKYESAEMAVWTTSARQAFESLSKDQQSALVLFYFEGYTFDEIADELGIAKGNVKHYVYRGLERMKRLLLVEPKEKTEGTEEGVIDATRNGSLDEFATRL